MRIIQCSTCDGVWHKAFYRHRSNMKFESVTCTCALNNCVQPYCLLCLIKNHVMKYGDWKHSSTHFSLGTEWGWVLNLMLQLLYPLDESSQYPLDRSLCGSCWSGHGGERNFCPCQESDFSCLAHNQSLYWLNYPGSSVQIKILIEQLSWPHFTNHIFIYYSPCG
jgi:hypothetical protein